MKILKNCIPREIARVAYSKNLQKSHEYCGTKVMKVVSKSNERIHEKEVYGQKAGWTKISSIFYEV
jgi:hypothetical protein